MTTLKLLYHFLYDFSIILERDKYNYFGVSWFYVLDTANKRFKLPRTKRGFQGLRGNVANDIQETLPNIVGHIWTETHNTADQCSGAFLLEDTMGGSSSTDKRGVKYTFDASRCCNTYQNNALVQERATEMYLYFYVGEFEENAVKQTAGITSEQLNEKLDVNHLNDTKPYVIEVSDKGILPSWYRIYSDGWCEQGGYATDWGTSAVSVITFLKEFKNTQYFVIINQTSGTLAALVTNRTTTSFSKSGNQGSDCWMACGYIK